MILSIIIPVYNSEKYLKDCLESVFNKFSITYEVIIVNDGSIDKSISIIDEFKYTYTNVKVVNQKNSGVNKARERGVEIAKGNFIMFIDSDDLLYDSNFLNEFLTAKDKSDVDIVIGGIIEKNTDGVELPLFEYKNKYVNASQYVDNLLLKEVHWGPIARLFKRDLFVDGHIFNNIPKDLKIGEDAIMNIRLALKAKNIMYSDSMLYLYKRNDESLMSFNGNRKTEKEFITFQKLMLEKLDVNLFQDSIFYFKVINWIFYRKNGMLLKNEKKYKQELYRDININSKKEIIKKNSILLKILKYDIFSILYFYSIAIRMKLNSKI